ncbi:HAMP domain-containing protein [bacterium SCSIO 12696]|nr:HAMP domain-containing protein [bacterium SCSIO 12696]
MTKTKSYRLRIIAGISFFLFLATALFIALFQSHSLAYNDHYHRVLTSLTQLEQASQRLEQRGAYYLENAPRDFESYFRDVQVYYKNMQSDLQQFEAVLTELEQEQVNYQSGLHTIGTLGLLSQQTEDTAFVEDIRNTWKGFKAGVTDKLGSNEKEPRLEWGAEFLVEQGPILSRQITTLNDNHRVQLEHNQQLSQLILNSSLIVSGIFGLIAVVWFFYSIIMRVSRAAEACQRVANGDFGYKINNKSRDEIGLLIDAFNQLSNRSRLVLNILGGMSSAKNLSQALELLSTESQAFFHADFTGLLLPSADRQSLYLCGASPQGIFEQISHKTIPMNHNHGIARDIRQAFREKQPWRIGEIRLYSVRNANAGLLRDTSRATGCVEAVGIPLMIDNKAFGMLVFASHDKNSFQNDKVALFNNLGTSIADGLSRIRSSTERAPLKKAG